MADSRNAAIRGSLVGRRTPSVFRPQPIEAEHVEHPAEPRRVVLYNLQRRATLQAIFRGAAFNSVVDVSDNLQADPYLMRAAKHHGRPAGNKCPICRRTELVHLYYTFSDEFADDVQGRRVDRDQLFELADQWGAFSVVVVEVCPTCSWNHLVMTYVLGDGKPRRGRAART